MEGFNALLPTPSYVKNWCWGRVCGILTCFSRVGSLSIASLLISKDPHTRKWKCRFAVFTHNGQVSFVYKRRIAYRSVLRMPRKFGALFKKWNLKKWNSKISTLEITWVSARRKITVTYSCNSDVNVSIDFLTSYDKGLMILCKTTRKYRCLTVNTRHRPITLYSVCIDFHFQNFYIFQITMFYVTISTTARYLQRVTLVYIFEAHTCLSYGSYYLKNKDKRLQKYS